MMWRTVLSAIGCAPENIDRMAAMFDGKAAAQRRLAEMVYRKRISPEIVAYRKNRQAQIQRRGGAA